MKITFDQSRTNAVYPMTHLIMDPLQYENEAGGENNLTSRIVCRSGTPISIIYLAYFELETTFNGMNELFDMMLQPELDHLSRSATGELKKYFAFTVDSGHGEDPDSLLTKMCLSRILNVLGNIKLLTKVISKRSNQICYEKLKVP